MIKKLLFVIRAFKVLLLVNIYLSKLYLRVFVSAFFWLIALFLLSIRETGIDPNIDAIASALIKNYTLFLMVVLLGMDIAIDTFILDNKDGLFNEFKFLWWGFSITAIFALCICIAASVAESWPDKIPNGLIYIVMFAVFYIRFLSYIKVENVRHVQKLLNTKI